MSILDQIIQTKREEIAQRSAAVPIDQLKSQARSMPRPRNFFSAVTKKPTKLVNLIAEVKKASPSAGIIRADFDPVAIAKAYAAAGADALSVLTDEKYFQGHLSYIKAVRDVVDLPVLRKDFIIDEYQVYEARAAGADAILLIADRLETARMLDLQILATELNLTCLIEVHTMEDLMRVRDCVVGVPMRGYSLIGINNRDLNTFKTDLKTTLRLAELIENRDVLVSESGIHQRADVQKLADAGVRAILVGESLMRSDDIGGKIKELIG